MKRLQSLRTPSCHSYEHDMHVIVMLYLNVVELRSCDLGQMLLLSAFQVLQKGLYEAANYLIGMKWLC